MIGNIIEQEFSTSMNWNLGSGSVHRADDLCTHQHDVYGRKHDAGKETQRMVKRFFMKFYLVLIIAFLYIPIAVLVVLSFNASRSQGCLGRIYAEVVSESAA